MAKSEIILEVNTKSAWRVAGKFARVTVKP